jgi:glycosyltransferase involved in cell wall biosynthesis
MIIQNKVRIIMDYSHVSWVLGGLFREMSEHDLKFFYEPTSISNIRNRKIIKSFFAITYFSFTRAPLFFTSLTPLQNFIKINPFKTNSKILFFTHYENNMSKKIISLLNSVDLIFCHSVSEKDNLESLGVETRIVVIIGAIDPKRFSASPSSGSKIAWVGTPVNRKNPEIFLKFAYANPEIHFKLIGKGWNKHYLWKDIISLKNIEYKEIVKPLDYQDFDECSHYLMISNVEGGPISLLEALAAGLVPICTPVGIVNEVLTSLEYENQILSFPISFNEITTKYKNFYSNEFKLSAKKSVKEYSVSRLCMIFKNEIQQIIK